VSAGAPNGLSRTVTSIYICHWSLRDPLCQTQTLAYLRELAKSGYHSALITFEQSQHKFESARRKIMKRELAEEGIYWYPIHHYHTLPMFDSGYNILRAILKGLWIQVRHHPRIVHPRGSFPSSIALPLAQLCGLRFLYDADSILSEEYVDNGYWSKESLTFRFTSWIESVSRKRADAVVVLSQRLHDDFIRQHGIRAPVEVIPCCVDLELFVYTEQARQERRRQLQLADDEKLFVYVGKLGPRYLVQEMFEFFGLAKARLGGARLLILSGDSPDGFHRLAAATGLASEDYAVRRAGRGEVPEWLSAADAGLSFVRSADCERGSSPVKIGEYLATRLPVMITEAIGDYSGWISQHRLGVVVKSLDQSGHSEAIESLADLWDDPSLGDRCRNFAEENLSLKSVAALRYDRTYKRLLARTPAPGE
jgi:glycosyltransferase involved in cell wall biosynthesis